MEVTLVVKKVGPQMTIEEIIKSKKLIGIQNSAHKYIEFQVASFYGFVRPSVSGGSHCISADSRKEALRIAMINDYTVHVFGISQELYLWMAEK